jgi:hypothetical protein
MVMKTPMCRRCGQPLDLNTARKLPGDAGLGPRFQTAIVRCSQCKTDHVLRLPKEEPPKANGGL